MQRPYETPEHQPDSGHQMDNESHLMPDQGQHAHLEPVPTSEPWHVADQAYG